MVEIILKYLYKSKDFSKSSTIECIQHWVTLLPTNLNQSIGDYFKPKSYWCGQFTLNLLNQNYLCEGLWPKSYDTNEIDSTRKIYEFIVKLNFDIIRPINEDIL